MLRSFVRALLVVLVTATMAQASPFTTWQITGTVTGSTNAQAGIGSTLTGTMTLDLGAIDTDANANLGAYSNAVVFDLDIGSLSFTTPPQIGPSAVNVQDGLPAVPSVFPSDVFSARATSAAFVTFSLSWTDASDGTKIVGDDIPAVLPDFANFVGEFTVITETSGPGFIIGGTLNAPTQTQAVPTPASLALIGSATVALVAFASRRRRQ